MSTKMHSSRTDDIITQVKHKPVKITRGAVDGNRFKKRY
ncbi:BgTH12-00225 [Blumeria graminis f. sp. triticale]|uniref:BgTH12-00225 n=1 Tax=Blumeria graminis f. sp. triticale TaxID=1689686 RepID=A0A9W4DBC5_BLUGR|nr:BgTH12-00225 [Blumeria graminis f. sp. triticale]